MNQPGPTEPTGPVVIGGIGGSGTRVVGDIVRGLGVYMGSDLNASADNLWATLLLRRPGWFRDSRLDGDVEIHRALAILGDAAGGRLQLDVAAEKLLARAADDFCQQGLSRQWSQSRVASLLEQGQSGISHPVWGWKEPNSHVYVELIGEHFGHSRYVHVIRNGLDMAYSTNQWQLATWGWLYGLAVITSASDVSPTAALEYWIRANRAAIETSLRLLGERFLVVNFDELCAHPEREVTRLAAFVGTDVPAAHLAELANIPQGASSSGRWRRRGSSAFSQQQLEEVAALGFAVR